MPLELSTNAWKIKLICINEAVIQIRTTEPETEIEYRLVNEKQKLKKYINLDIKQQVLPLRVRRQTTLQQCWGSGAATARGRARWACVPLSHAPAKVARPA